MTYFPKATDSCVYFPSARGSALHYVHQLMVSLLLSVNTQTKNRFDLNSVNSLFALCVAYDTRMPCQLACRRHVMAQRADCPLNILFKEKEKNREF